MTSNTSVVWMLSALVAAGLTAVVVGVGISLVRLSRFRHESSVDWLHRFSLDRYKLMLRLFSPRDVRFLGAQPGFTPELLVQFRRRRARVFKLFLNRLVSDYRRLESIQVLLLLNSQHDRSEAVLQLLVRRLTFMLALALVRIRLLLFGWGISGQVDASRLIQALSGLRLQLAHIALARQISAY